MARSCGVAATSPGRLDQPTQLPHQGRQPQRLRPGKSNAVATTAQNSSGNQADATDPGSTETAGVDVARLGAVGGQSRQQRPGSNGVTLHRHQQLKNDSRH